MDSVKRRLVYVADENEELVRLLTTGGTPPTRPSRFSRLHVSASGSSSKASSRHDPSAPPADSPVPTTVADPLLIVSYDGNLIADGSGHLRYPRNYGEAQLVRRQLRTCFHFLTQYMHQVSSATSSEEGSGAGEELSASSSASSSSYAESSVDDDDEYDDSDDDDDADNYPRKRVRRARARGRSRGATSKSATPPVNVSAMTVAEMRSALRDRGLPVAGNKATLEERLRLFVEDGQEMSDDVAHAGVGRSDGKASAEAVAVEAVGGVKRPRASSSSSPRTSGRGSASLHDAQTTSMTNQLASDATPSSSSMSMTSARTGSQHRFSHVVSPPVRETPTNEPTRQSRGLWGALVNVGSRLFGQATASQSPYPPHDAGELSYEPPTKRRRSA